MADVCIQCRKKPKYKPHPYCGKTCASEAKKGYTSPTQHSSHTRSLGTRATCPCGQPVWRDSNWCSIACMSATFSSMTTAAHYHPMPPAYLPSTVSPESDEGLEDDYENLFTPSFAPPNLSGICAMDGCSRPALIDASGRKFDFCGPECRLRGMAQRAALGSRVCLSCRFREQAPGKLFCQVACFEQLGAKGSAIIEVPKSHPKFRDVAHQFKSSWKHGLLSTKEVKHVYLIVVNPDQRARYESYKARVEGRGRFKQRNMEAGNERRRWHGTTRACLLGDPGKTTICSLPACSLCSIIKTSFDIAQYKKKTNWGRFGRGIYTSATSSKSDSYSHNTTNSPLKALLLNKVVVGNGQKITKDSKELEEPAPGYDSVLGEPGEGGALRFDECVVYSNDAIVPAYLVMYS